MFISIDASKQISAKEQAALNRLHDLLESQFEEIRRSVGTKPSASTRRHHHSTSCSTCEVNRKPQKPATISQKPSGRKEEFTIADLTESESEKRARLRESSKLEPIAEH